MSVSSERRVWTEAVSQGQSFGEVIRALRRDRRVTQRTLAKAVGIDFTYLSKLENDRGDPPGDHTIRRLAKELGADEEQLLALAGKVPPELRKKALEDAEFAMFLRRLPELSPEVLKRVYRQAKEK